MKYAQLPFCTFACSLLESGSVIDSQTRKIHLAELLVISLGLYLSLTQTIFCVITAQSRRERWLSLIRRKRRFPAAGSSTVASCRPIALAAGPSQAARTGLRRATLTGTAAVAPPRGVACDTRERGSMRPRRGAPLKKAVPRLRGHCFLSMLR